MAGSFDLQTRAAVNRHIFRCEVEARDKTVVLRPVGELDIATIEAFAAEADRLLGEGFQQLVLDLRQLAFLDSSGLGAIVKLHATATHATRLQIIDGPDNVRRLFAITGLRQLLPFASAADALGETRPTHDAPS